MGGLIELGRFLNVLGAEKVTRLCVRKARFHGCVVDRSRRRLLTSRNCELQTMHPRRVLAVRKISEHFERRLDGNEYSACGSIRLIVGPMFAGKSTALLQSVQAEADAGRNVALVKSDKDTRYGLTAVVTHDGLQMPCFAVSDLATFKATIGEQRYKELDVIGIDEAQFFKDLCSFCQTAADLHGKTLIVAGLDGDFLRRRFGSVLDLIPLADSVVKLSSKCEICGRLASFSFRKTFDKSTEVIGGGDVYMPVCRQHFVSGQIALDTATNVLAANQAAEIRMEA